MELAGLRIADPPARWAALGFDIEGERIALGGVELKLGAPGAGIVSWALRGAPVVADIDGLVTTATAEPAPAAKTPHPNGAVALDHVVVITPDFERTAAALEAAGMPLRRIRDAGSFRQGFRRLGPIILELVELTGDVDKGGPARFWGLVVICADLSALRERLHPHLGAIKPAVQPGRHIATLESGGALSTRVAFMDPDDAALPIGRSSTVPGRRAT